MISPAMNKLANGSKPVQPVQRIRSVEMITPTLPSVSCRSASAHSKTAAAHGEDMEKYASHVMAMSMTVSMIGLVLMVMRVVVIAVVVMLMVVNRTIMVIRMFMVARMVMVTMTMIVAVPVIMCVITCGAIAVTIGLAHIVLSLCTPEGSNQAPTRPRRPLAEHASGTGRCTVRHLTVSAKRFASHRYAQPQIPEPDEYAR